MKNENKQRRKSLIIKNQNRKNSQEHSFSGLKQELHKIAGIYIIPDRPPSTKKSHQGKKITEQSIKMKRNFSIPISKEKQELYEENIAVKKEANRLQQQLSSLQHRLHLSRRQTRRKNKQLELQFSKQMYWNGNKTHLVEGIKVQYQNLKQSYNLKCKENQQIKRQLLNTKLPQILVYNQFLQTQNRRLSNLLNQTSANPSQLSQQKVLKLSERLKQTKDKLKLAQNEITTKEKKIMFLEKLIIQKQNNEYHAHKTIKRNQKLQQQLHNHNEKLKQQLQSFQDVKEEEINEFKEEFEARMQAIAKKHKMEVEEKEKTIQRLQFHIEELDSAITDLQISNAIDPNSKVDINNLLQVKDGRNKESQEMTSSQTNFFLSTLAKVVVQVVQSPNAKQRKPITAEQPHSQHSKKVRKIQLVEIEHIVQYLKYKLIKEDVSPESIKSYFDYDILTLEHQNSNEEWNKDYINMKEVISILMKNPFALGEEDALLLARFAVEDANHQYVYCDENNEQKRQLVKSIMKSILSGYELSSPSTKEQYEEFIERYSENILPALTMRFPSGKVPSRKFIQIIDGLGLDASSAVKQHALANLASVSRSMNELNYGIIFKQK